MKTAHSATVARMRVLGRKARRQEATAAEIVELAALETAFYSPGQAKRTIYDLQIAARMWSADARERGAA